MKIFPLLLAPLAAVLLTLAACSSAGPTTRLPRGQNAPADAPAMIGHIVFIELKNPADYHTILHDSDWMLGTIPSVATYAAGRHLDTGRSTVRSDYDLAIYLGFKNEADLRAFVNHPQHINYFQKWKPKLKALRVYDMIDWPTTRLGVRN